jgi:antiviral helicase SKI2
MADSLLTALEKVRLSSSTSEADDWIDHILDSQRPRKRIKQDPEALKLSLEEKYLTPSTSFSPEWLNKLQQYLPRALLLQF